MRRLLLITILVAAGLFLAPTAKAGVGASQECTSGVTYGTVEIPIINTPITFNLETGNGHLVVCYSSSPNGYSGPSVAGGSLWLAAPNRDFVCREDANTTVGLFCIAAVRDTFIVVAVDPRFGGTRAPTGVFVGAIEGPACVRDVTLTTPSGNLGPFDVGLCP